MSEIFYNIFIVIMVVMGVVPTVYIIVALPAVIIWKLFRMTQGYKITD